MIKKINGSGTSISFYKDLTDLECWSKFKEGDREAYRMIYNRYSELMLRYGKKIVNDSEIIKDNIHDLFLEIWKSRKNLSDTPSVKNYLLKSLRRKLIKEQGRNYLKISDEEYVEPLSGLANSKEMEIILGELDFEHKENLNKALSKLTSRQKEVVFLIFYNDCSPQEVASIMSVEVRTVYNTLYNALQVLKKNLPQSLFMILYFKLSLESFLDF